MPLGGDRCRRRESEREAHSKASYASGRTDELDEYLQALNLKMSARDQLFLPPGIRAGYLCSSSSIAAPHLHHSIVPLPQLPVLSTQSSAPAERSLLVVTLVIQRVTALANATKARKLNAPTDFFRVSTQRHDGIRVIYDGSAFARSARGRMIDLRDFALECF